jgi:hypothetical protein
LSTVESGIGGCWRRKATEGHDPPHTAPHERVSEATGAGVALMSVAEFRAFVSGERAKYLNVIKETGVTSQ